MADDKQFDPPTNYLLMKTRSRVPWALIIVVAVFAGAAGGLLWFFLAR